jgi:hypothetical protein
MGEQQKIKRKVRVGKQNLYSPILSMCCLLMRLVAIRRKNGNVGGQKFEVDNKKHALICASHQDCHFTILGFSNALGQPVCCVIIIAAAQVTAQDIMGLQRWAETIGDPAIDFEQNSHGTDKYYPYGPTCTIFGKTISTFVTCSESGSITSNILMDVLRHIDHCVD